MAGTDMYLMPLADTFATQIYLTFALYILGKNARGRINVAAAGMMVSFALWSAGQAVMQWPGVSLGAYSLAARVSAPGWISYSSFALLTTLLFVKNTTILALRPFHIVNFGLPLLFIVAHALGLLFEEPVAGGPTFLSRWRLSAWSASFLVYHYTANGMLLMLLAGHMFRAADPAKRRQAANFFGTSLLCQCIGLLTETVLPALGVTAVPRLAHVTALIWASAWGYTVARYRLFVVSTASAADTIVATMDDALIVLDSRRRVKGVNPSLAKAIGCGAETLIGKPITALVSSRSAELMDLAGMNRESDTRKIEIELVPTDGSAHIADASVSVLSAPDGEIAGYVIVANDITDRKFMEDNLRRLVKDLQRSNEELKRFVMIASHHLQEPLRSVASYLQLLEKRLSGHLDRDSKEFMEFAVDGAVWMKHLVTDLVSFVTLSNQRPRLSKVDCNAVLQAVVRNLSGPLAAANGRVEAAPLPTVTSDHRALTRLFQDLVGNAVKFHREDPTVVGVVAKMVAVPEGSGGCGASRRHRGTWWQFSVRDNGIGIPSEFHEKIFGVFEKLHPRTRYVGTGIGLAMCRTIVERHGGSIWVESEPGTGSTFHFTLPEAPANIEEWVAGDV